MSSPVPDTKALTDGMPLAEFLEGSRLFAHELEVYGAEEEPRVNVHKQMFRSAAKLLRSLLRLIENDRRELKRLRAMEKRAKAALIKGPMLRFILNGEQDG